MAILLTGGTGKTSLRLASLLSTSTPPIPFLLLARNPPPQTSLSTSKPGSPTSAPASLPYLKFDWSDPSTHIPVLTYSFPNNEKISAIYLIAPQSPSAAADMISFIDLAIKHEVKRFVLLTGSDAEPVAAGAGPADGHVVGSGRVWGRLQEMKREQGVRFTVLRATWFMGMFPLSFSHLLYVCRSGNPGS